MLYRYLCCSIFPYISINILYFSIMVLIGLLNKAVFYERHGITTTVNKVR